MSTGYTSKIYDGKAQSFAEFALYCARAFGALVEMREDPMDAKIPLEFKPSTYHRDRLAETKTELAKWQNMSLAEAAKHEAASYAKAIDEEAAYQEKKKALRERYETMLAHVLAWEPPTPEHKGLKDFMTSQLRESIDFDCRDYSNHVRRVAPAQWLKERIETAQNSIAYHEKEWARDQEMARTRTAWVADLRKSL